MTLSYLEAALSSLPLSADAARAYAAQRPQDPGAVLLLMRQAAARRDAIFGRRITFSPKVFLPLTNLCRDICDYCAFRRSPKEAGAWTMSPDEVRAFLDQGAAQGCIEALFCLGDRPESAFRSYRDTLHVLGHASTVDYLCWAGAEALARGLLPHTNAGILTPAELMRLKHVNASLGLMLESTSERLCEKGMPHHRAPDKRPAVRLAMTQAAGELAIPFTSGILIGIGETVAERIETLLAIRDLHRRFGHIQEVIVQNFCAHPQTPMAAAPEPADHELLATIALARLLLDDDVSVQAPPNLSPGGLELLIRAGINDLGGISPVTPDYINPSHPWPHLGVLRGRLGALGYELAPRLPIYDRYISRPGFVAEPMAAPIRRVAERLGATRDALLSSPLQAEPTPGSRPETLP